MSKLHLGQVGKGRIEGDWKGAPCSPHKGAAEGPREQQRGLYTSVTAREAREDDVSACKKSDLETCNSRVFSEQQRKDS